MIIAFFQNAHLGNYLQGSEMKILATDEHCPDLYFNCNEEAMKNVL